MSKTKEKSLYKKIILPIIAAFIAAGVGILGVTNFGLGRGLNNHYKNELAKQTEVLIASANEQKKHLESSMEFFSARERSPNFCGIQLLLPILLKPPHIRLILPM